MMTNRIVVTGASGFVGRQAVRALHEAGFEVHALGRHPPSDGAVIWHGCDLLAESASPLLMQIRPSHLLHCAWVTEHGAYWASPLNRDWITASQALFTAFADAGGSDIIALGSCAEYDWNRTDRVPWRESDPCLPATLYGAAKLELSAWLSEFAARTGLRQAWLRLFFLFGDGEPAARIVPYLIDCALSGAVARCSSGHQIRDFIDTKTAGRALAAIAASDLTGPLNLGSGIGVSVRDLAGLIAQATGKRLECEFGALPDRPSDPPSIVADLSRLAKVTTARFDIEKALADYAALFGEVSFRPGS